MVNQNLPRTPKTFLRTISVVHTALILGVILFSAVTISDNINHNVFTYNTNDPFTDVSLLLAIGGFTASVFLFKKQLVKAKKQFTLKEKITLYQSALIQRFALLEGPAMFAVVSYELSRNLYFLIIAGLLILYFISIRPTKDKIETDLDLSYEDKLTFDSEDTQL
ncbi:hypothetical protein HDF19_02510 [Mucilaginibacter sp. E4BP6]|uniref:hypothetical protein n=1 Tax=Mucilaginibacter sp. E4BP6 TaxID=2723089 RepID=UPI0015C7941D|nr:hypothetical protein [Mucilaginibacter sp. E4BP6]NYE64328.1 hypothetical protein [Mucilaginibacter sp. E4BP6]